MDASIEQSTTVTAPEPQAAAPEPQQAAQSSSVSEPPPAKEAPAPTPELTLREKIQKKAAEVAAKSAKPQEKSPKTAAKAGVVPAKEEPRIPPEPGLVGAAEPEKAAEPGTYTPNYKFKVMEKEHEIPEILRGAMKDAESEKQVREIMEKAYGLDIVKPRYNEAREQVKVLSQENAAVHGHINEAKALYARGDLDGFFKKLVIPEERILQWVADKINYNQLPPEQKQILDARKQAEDRALVAERQVGSLQSQHEQALGQQVQFALQSALARPDVKAVAESFDARVGKPGAFEAEIRRRGDYHWQTKNELVPPDTLVQEMMAFLGPVAPAAQNQQVQAANPAAPAQQTQAAPQAAGQAKTTPVIPNISGRSASGLAPKVKSIADLKNRYKEMQGT